MLMFVFGSWGFRNCGYDWRRIDFGRDCLAQIKHIGLCLGDTTVQLPGGFNGLGYSNVAHEFGWACKGDRCGIRGGRYAGEVEGVRGRFDAGIDPGTTIGAEAFGADSDRSSFVTVRTIHLLINPLYCLWYTIRPGLRKGLLRARRFVPVE